MLLTMTMTWGTSLGYWSLWLLQHSDPHVPASRGAQQEGQETELGLSRPNGSRLTDFATWRNFQGQQKFALPLAHDISQCAVWDMPNTKRKMMCLIHLLLKSSIKLFLFIQMQHLHPVLYNSFEYAALSRNQVFTALHKCQLMSNLLPDCVPTIISLSPRLSS